MGDEGRNRRSRVSTIVAPVAYTDTTSSSVLEGGVECGEAARFDGSLPPAWPGAERHEPGPACLPGSGGKLLVFHGWADHAVSVYTRTDYHGEGVEKLGGSPEVDAFFRLFLLPGVLHCSGGDGPDQVDWIGALERWAEAGEAPDRLVSVRFGKDEEVVISRPICPHPRRAVYDGVGDPKREASFTCSEP